LPDTLKTLVANVERRAAQLTDLDNVRVIECADAATAALIAGDRTLRSLCRPIGDRHLAVSPDTGSALSQSPDRARLRHSRARPSRLSPGGARCSQWSGLSVGALLDDRQGCAAAGDAK
jgi:hypothetical protein